MPERAFPNNDTESSEARHAQQGAWKIGETSNKAKEYSLESKIVPGTGNSLGIPYNSVMVL